MQENNNEKKNLSRRNFIKNMGAGVAGAVTVPPLLKAQAKKLPGEISDSLQGKTELSIKVNGKLYKKNIKPETTLAEFIRNELKLTGTKITCDNGECGGCTVLLNDEAVYSCHLLALDANGMEVITIEGLMTNDELSKVQQAFVDKDGLQCGFCTPGQIMSAYALLLKNPNPNEEQILEAMSGNVCRCSAYPKIVESVDAASKLMKGE